MAAAIDAAAGEDAVNRIPYMSSLPFRLALFYAVNPDEELSTLDIAVKYDADPAEVQKRLRVYVQQGIFGLKSTGPGRGKVGTYTAGPVLLQMVGGKLQREMIAACMPIRVRRVTIVSEG